MTAAARMLGLAMAGILSLLLSACDHSRAGSMRGNLSPDDASADNTRPLRVVSLDYCADQYLLQLADREQILALSPDSEKPFSYLRKEARGIATVRAVAEDVLTLRPDLIIRSYGGGVHAPGFFARAGIPVVQLPWINAVDGAGEDSIPSAIALVAQALKQEARGADLIATYRSKLAAYAPLALRGAEGAHGEHAAPEKAVLYMSAAGYTSGPGTLMHAMLDAAGLNNYETRYGWHPLPLEKLVYRPPQHVAAAFFGNAGSLRNGWSASHHPIAQRLQNSSTAVLLDGSTTACGAWFLTDAIDQLIARHAP